MAMVAHLGNAYSSLTKVHTATLTCRPDAASRPTHRYGVTVPFNLDVAADGTRITPVGTWSHGRVSDRLAT